MKQYIVDAFTNKPFSGNPAAVCVMESWPSEESMMKLAMENNLSETAFIVKENTGYHLRWFTPGTEVELCGHATLASSYVILNFYEKDSDEVRFSPCSYMSLHLLQRIYRYMNHAMSLARISSTGSVYLFSAMRVFLSSLRANTRTLTSSCVSLSFI